MVLQIMKMINILLKLKIDKNNYLNVFQIMIYMKLTGVYKCKHVEQYNDEINEQIVYFQKTNGIL